MSAAGKCDPRVMKASAAACALIQEFEGCRLKAYPDPGTGNSPWTIGWGTTRGVKQGMEITQEEADELFREDVAAFAQQVGRLVSVPLGQHQFDALTSFVYNIGPTSFRDSTLRRLLNEGEYEGAARQFGRWIKGGDGNPLPGLVRRRAAERKLFEDSADFVPGIV